MHGLGNVANRCIGFVRGHSTQKLLGVLQLSNHRSLLEELRDHIVALPGALEGIPYAGHTAGVLAPLIANLIPSRENWWIYRCLDPLSHTLMIEWNITKKVLDEYGPAVRGVLIVMFHGERPTGSVRFWPAFCFRADSLASHDAGPSAGARTAFQPDRARLVSFLPLRRR